MYQVEELVIIISYRRRSSNTRAASRERWRHHHRIEGLLGGGEVAEGLNAAISPEIHGIDTDILDLFDLKWDIIKISL